MSAETIYEAFYLEPKGRLKDLGLSLPSGRTQRRTRTSVREQSPRKRFVDEFCSIDQRLAEANDRAVPGHWEGGSHFGQRKQVSRYHTGRTHNTVYRPRSSTWAS